MFRIAAHSCRTTCCTLLALVALTASARLALGHVEIATPNGGETLTGGASHTIQWRPTVAPHDTLNFDVWYSTATADGPWTVIAADLPPGNLAVDSLHTHSWLVPNITDASAWIRVRQENGVDQDYEDVSEGSFSIAAAPLQGDYNSNGSVDAADYSVWRDSLGRTGTGLAADGNGNNQVDVNDYGIWRTNFGDSSGSAAIGGAAVPEPGAALLVLLATVCLPPRHLNRSLRLWAIAQ